MIHIKKTGKFSIFLIVILGLLILLYAFYATWNTGNGLATGSGSEVCYSPNEDELNVKITMTEAGDANIYISVCTVDFPLALIQEMSISKLRLRIDQAEYVLDGQYDEKMFIEGGEGNMTISIDAVPSTECQLIISELTGYAKGEGPLFIRGNWTN